MKRFNTYCFCIMKCIDVLLLLIVVAFGVCDAFPGTPVHQRNGDQGQDTYTYYYQNHHDIVKRSPDHEPGNGQPANHAYGNHGNQGHNIYTSNLRFANGYNADYQNRNGWDLRNLNSATNANLEGILNHVRGQMATQDNSNIAFPSNNNNNNYKNVDEENQNTPYTFKVSPLAGLPNFANIPFAALNQRNIQYPAISGTNSDNGNRDANNDDRTKFIPTIKNDDNIIKNTADTKVEIINGHIITEANAGIPSYLSNNPILKRPIQSNVFAESYSFANGGDYANNRQYIAPLGSFLASPARLKDLQIEDNDSKNPLSANKDIKTESNQPFDDIHVDNSNNPAVTSIQDNSTVDTNDNLGSNYSFSEYNLRGNPPKVTTNDASISVIPLVPNNDKPTNYDTAFHNDAPLGVISLENTRPFAIEGLNDSGVANDENVSAEVFESQNNSNQTDVIPIDVQPEDIKNDDDLSNISLTSGESSDVTEISKEDSRNDTSSESSDVTEISKEDSRNDTSNVNSTNILIKFENDSSIDDNNTSSTNNNSSKSEELNDAQNTTLSYLNDFLTDNTADNVTENSNDTVDILSDNSTTSAAEFNTSSTDTVSTSVTSNDAVDSNTSVPLVLPTSYVTEGAIISTSPATPSEFSLSMLFNNSTNSSTLEFEITDYTASDEVDTFDFVTVLSVPNVTKLSNDVEKLTTKKVDDKTTVLPQTVETSPEMLTQNNASNVESTTIKPVEVNDETVPVKTNNTRNGTDKLTTLDNKTTISYDFDDINVTIDDISITTTDEPEDLTSGNATTFDFINQTERETNDMDHNTTITTEKSISTVKLDSEHTINKDDINVTAVNNANKNKAILTPNDTVIHQNANISKDNLTLEETLFSEEYASLIDIVDGIIIGNDEKITKTLPLEKSNPTKVQKGSPGNQRLQPLKDSQEKHESTANGTSTPTATTVATNDSTIYDTNDTSSTLTSLDDKNGLTFSNSSKNVTSNKTSIISEEEKLLTPIKVSESKNNTTTGSIEDRDN